MIQYEYAISISNNRVIHISELTQSEKGANCYCRCVLCNRPMVAKLGNHRIHHFAHLQDNDATDCNADIANESGLHKMAKQIIADNHQIVLPPLFFDGSKDPNCNYDDPNQLKRFECMPEYTYSYQTTRLELSQTNFTPDVVLSSEKGSLYVEIAVTHFIDEEKQQKIEAHGQSTIEIDISEFHKCANLTIEKLKDALLSGVEHKKWIYNKRSPHYLSQLSNRNRQLQLKFEREKKRQQKEQIKKEQWKEQQNALRSEIEKNIFRLENDNSYYTELVLGLRNDTAATQFFEDRSFYHASLSKYGGIPYFCNIPVFGEVVFTCDRRIWQMRIFENFFYKRKGTTIQWAKIYSYFYKNEQENLSDRFVYTKNKEFKYYNFEDLLARAIREYLGYLSLLGFLAKSTNILIPEMEYDIKKNTIEAPNKEYEPRLKSALDSLHDSSCTDIQLQKLLDSQETT